MNERFRFRVWQKEKEHMYQNAAVGVGKNRVGYKLANIKNKYVWEETDEFIINQYTGFKDKAGIWIFEGDLVKFGNKRTYLTEVIWDEYKFAFKNVDTDKVEDKFSNWGKIKHVKVVGNIYENPELLEDEETED